jgi:hypothetical protein
MFEQVKKALVYATLTAAAKVPIRKLPPLIAVILDICLIFEMGGDQHDLTLLSSKIVSGVWCLLLHVSESYFYSLIF